MEEEYIEEVLNHETRCPECGEFRVTWDETLYVRYCPDCGWNEHDE